MTPQSLTTLLLAAVSGLLCACAAAPTTPERPNVILFMSDDQGYGDLGFTGTRVNPMIVTTLPTSRSPRD